MALGIPGRIAKRTNLGTLSALLLSSRLKKGSDGETKWLPKQFRIPSRRRETLLPLQELTFHNTPRTFQNKLPRPKGVLPRPKGIEKRGGSSPRARRALKRNCRTHSDCGSGTQWRDWRLGANLCPTHCDTFLETERTKSRAIPAQQE